MFTINQNAQNRIQQFFAKEGTGSEQVQSIPIEEKVTTLPNAELDKLIDNLDSADVEKLLTAPVEMPEQIAERVKQDQATAARKKEDEEEEETQRAMAEKKKKDGETDEQQKTRLAAESAQRKQSEKAAEKLFAGKYKTKEELIQGFENATKVLNYSDKFVKVLVEYAKKTGDYSTIEELYPDLDKAISSNQKAAQLKEMQQKEESKRSDKSATAGTPTLDANVRSEMSRLAVDGAIQNMPSTPVGRELAEAGITLPSNFLYDKEATTKFLKDLRTEDPVIFLHLEQEIVSSVQRNLKEVEEVYAALNDSETKNPQLIEAEKGKIKALAKEVGLTLEEADLTKFIEGLKNIPEVYELKNGVQFIRPDAISKRWIVENFENIKKQIRLNAQIEGRTQAIEDLNTNKKKVPGSISNTNIPTDQRNRQEKAGTIDTSDAAQKEALTDAQLDELIEKGVPVSNK